ncbi:DsrE family protein [Thermosulfuriphilus ammonigenes]|uniref:DsrE family protein n=1 Tax=Thermosulfuriphilus ammonigenes TaxID=1936021 RepID=A0A6G7PX19_9BACT|nr:DsrE family protein [Thermosulfuriphilus ammonigenes]MBA2849706.1 uncharacterized protein involved in oxidation of intracellular sulfur [Thermosulfuriphilus ammonigenes]QIJ72202.1 DsrE family protein [Thermosulfuriphilus ammonigenes]
MKAINFSLLILVILALLVGVLKAQEANRLAIVISTNDPETAWQALRIANFALSKGDQVTIFLLGKGVTISEIDSDEFDIDEKLESFLDEGGRLIACGTAMKMHQISPSELCPRGGRKDLYRLIWSSDKVLTF